MALHKTAFTDKLHDWLKQSKPNVSMLTEKAWALAQRNVLAWDSIPASERELADAITTETDLNNALGIPEDMAIDADMQLWNIEQSTIWRTK
eukprot:jgi/Tetstr1/465885/TSEL_010502.t1